MKTKNFTEREKAIFNQVMNINDEVEMMLFIIETPGFNSEIVGTYIENLKIEVEKLEGLFKTANP